MKKLFLILAVLVFAVPAMTQPYITADPQTDASKYRMRMKVKDSATWGDWVEAPPVDNRLLFDISGVPTNHYDGEAQAGAEWELTDMTGMITTTVYAWSASAPFLLKVKRGNAPAQLTVLK